MLTIKDFTADHTAQAQQIALHNYNSMRRFVPALPPIEGVPDLSPFAENRLGIAAFDGNQMVGFLCSLQPFRNAFRSTDAVGVFSPMGANGAIGENRAAVYARMYQEAGAKWVKAGAASHAVCLYTHDREVQEQFFRYGFGMRCVDAIRSLEDIPAPASEVECADLLDQEYDVGELDPGEIAQVLRLDHMLDAHMAASPCFILRPSVTEEAFVNQAAQSRVIIIAAKQQGKLVAYIRAEENGETFICNTTGYLHITGAFCLPEHRGKGLNQRLLHELARGLNKDGFTRLGVDFESINPAAYGFWLKHFDAYTCGLVRRIDEHVLPKEG